MDFKLATPFMEAFEELDTLEEADTVDTTSIEATPATDPFAGFSLSDSVEDALEQYPDDFELEYEGFVDDWEEDRFDPDSRYGHYTVSKSTAYDDHSYSVSAYEIFETLADSIIPRNMKLSWFAKNRIQKKEHELRYSSSKEAVISKLKKLVEDYYKLEALCTELDDPEKLDIFIADNLETFFELFYDELEDYYMEEARDQARRNQW